MKVSTKLRVYLKDHPLIAIISAIGSLASIGSFSNEIFPPSSNQVEHIRSIKITNSPNSETKNSKSTMIQVKGVGLSSIHNLSAVVKERSSILAASLDAKRKLAEWLKGNQIENVTIVNNQRVSSDTIRSYVQAHIGQVKMVNEKYNPIDGSSIVILEMKINKTDLRE